jgi:hypothetical protein
MSTTLTMARGEVREFTITVKDPDGSATNLTGKRLTFTAKLDRNSSDVYIQRFSTDSGIVVSAPLTGIGVMTIETADTEDLPNDTTLVWGVWLDDNTANPRKVDGGQLIIAAEVG